MKVCFFHLMPYRFLPDDFERRYRVQLAALLGIVEAVGGTSSSMSWSTRSRLASTASAAPEDILILPQEELMAVLWHDPASPAARQWAPLPEHDADNVAAQVESIARRAAMARFVWPIPDKGLRKRLHRIEAPTLLLWGETDRVNPVAYAGEWQRRIKGAAVKLLPGGHMLLHESPAAVSRMVEEFFV